MRKMIFAADITKVTRIRTLKATVEDMTGILSYGDAPTRGPL